MIRLIRSVPTMTQAAAALLLILVLGSAPGGPADAAAARAQGVQEQGGGAASERAARPEEGDFDRALAKFREAAESGHEALVKLGRDMLAGLNAAIEELAARYEQASGKAREEWEEMRLRLKELSDRAAQDLQRLSESAKEQWREARNTAAEALKKLADQIEAARQRTPAAKDEAR